MFIATNKNPIIATYFAIRNYKPHKQRKKFSRKVLSNKDIFLQKKLARLNRKQELTKNELAQQFIAWISLIQKKLDLSHENFVKRINENGGQVTLLTVRLWRNNHGHLPNERNFNALLRLEREANICKEESKVILGVAIAGEISATCKKNKHKDCFVLSCKCSCHN